MTGETPSENGIDYDNITPRDVIGFRVFNPSNGMGKGKVVGMKRVRGEPQFVCKNDPDAREVNRDVESVMRDLRKYSYELRTDDHDTVTVEDVEATGGVDEDEIKSRRSESWKRLADEFGITTDEVREIIVS